MSSINSSDPNNLLGYVGKAAFSGGVSGAGGSRGGGSGGSSWFEAMSRAWGQTLDTQASQITNLSDQIGAGADQPSNMVALTAASLKMQFISNNAATSQNSIGEAMNAVARKQ